MLTRSARLVKGMLRVAPRLGAPQRTMALFTGQLPLHQALYAPAAPFTASALFCSPVMVPAASFAKKAEKGNKKGKASSGSDADASVDGEEGTYGVNPSEFKEKMDEVIERLAADLTHVKVGRPSPEQLEDLSVDIGGGKRSNLGSIAQIYVKPPQALVVSLYEPTAALETAACQSIISCGLDLSPVLEEINGAPAIRVPFPKPTKELRESLVKAAKVKGEDYKAHVRHVRKLWMDKIKKQAPPKDDAKRMEGDAQKATDAANDAIAKQVVAKEKEIMAA